MVEAHVESDGHNPIVRMRQALFEDADAIRTLTREAYAKWVSVIGREPLPMTADYATALGKHRFDLLYVDGTMAGLVETTSKADHLLIENVAVAPAFQRQGLGGTLLDHAERLARAAGHAEVRLYTNKLFAENLRLYQKRSYRVDREETWTGGVIVHMAKRLMDGGSTPSWRDVHDGRAADLVADQADNDQT